MKKKNKKAGKKFPALKKEVKDFLLDEEGKITKKDVVKLGISLAVLGMALTPHDANPQTHTDSYGAHSSAFNTTAHNSNSPHSNHTSHGSHGSGSWMC